MTQTIMSHPQKGEVWRYTTLLSHAGQLISLAIDSRRTIYYVVLDSTKASQGSDAAAWPVAPNELVFPSEFVREGFAAISPDVIPRSSTSARSTTARFTADAPFKVVSDGTWVYVFRQSIDASHADALFRSSTGSVTSSGSRAAALVDRSLLVDRFLLTGSTLVGSKEVRFRRSRNRDRAQSRADTRGTEDMNGTPFYEPTRVLAFIHGLTEGSFTVSLLPTAIADVQRWQIFLHNRATGRLDSWNIARGADGWFDTMGSALYTSPDPRYRDAVLERAPGTCPFTGRGLIPADRTVDRGDTSVRLSTERTRLKLADAGALGLTGDFTIELWVRCSAALSNLVPLVTFNGVPLLAISPSAVSLRHPAQVTASTGVDWTHLALVRDSDSTSLYVDGLLAGSVTGVPTVSGAMSIGGECTEPGWDALKADVDEIHVWNFARSAADIAAHRHFRVRGDESGLTLALRCDEGAGNRLYDLTDHRLDATIEGTAEWVREGAPIGNHPGVDRTTTSLDERAISGGMDAVLYHQIEDRPSGHEGELRPSAQSARLMLALGTSGPATDAATAALPVTTSLVLHLEARSLVAGTAWNDLCSAGHNLSLVSGARWPRVVSVTGDEGHAFDAVRFEATAGLEAAASFQLSGDFTAFIVDRFWDDNVGPSLRAVTATTTSWQLGKTGDSGGSEGATVGVYTLGTPVLAEPGRFRVNTLCQNGTQAEWYLDGRQDGVLSGVSSAAGRLSLGRTALGDGGDVDVAAVLVFARALTSEERQQVELWLGRRFGVRDALTAPAPVTEGLILHVDGDTLEGGRWRDLSSAENHGLPVSSMPSRHLLQATTGAARQPFVVARFHDSDGIAFSGLLGLSRPFTIMVVDRFWGTERKRILQSQNGDWVLGRSGSGLHISINSNADISLADSTPEMLRVSAIAAASDGSAELRADGVQRLIRPDASAPDGLAIGQAGAYEDQSSDCDVACVLAWNRALSTAELQQVEGWLAGRYPLLSTLSTVTDFARSASVAVIDFGIGRDGSLARLPARQPLSVIRAAGVSTVDPALAAQVAAAEARVNDARAAADKAPDNVAAALSKLDRLKTGSVGLETDKGAVTALEATLAGYQARGITLYDDEYYRGAAQFLQAPGEIDHSASWASCDSMRLDDDVEAVFYYEANFAGIGHTVKTDHARFPFNKQNFSGGPKRYNSVKAKQSQGLKDKIRDTTKDLNRRKTACDDKQKLHDQIPAAQAALDQARQRQTSAEQELRDAEAALAHLRGSDLQGSQGPVAMPTLLVDARGLTANGAALDFALSGVSPTLSRSASGSVSLGFVGDRGKLMSVAYDVGAGRNVFTLPTAGTRPVTLISRSADAIMDATTVTVSGSDTETCTVEVANTEVGVEETWPQVPRDPFRFADVLSGDHSAWQLPLGRVAEACSGSIFSLKLKAGAERSAPAGSRLTVANTRLVLATEVSAGQTDLDVSDSGHVDIPQGALVLVDVVYDRGTVTTNHPAPVLALGSRLVRALPTGDGLVQNGSATLVAQTPSSRWLPDAPGAALRFTGTERLNADVSRSEWAITSDITVEGWIRSTTLTADATILHLAVSPKFHLGLSFQGGQIYPCVARGTQSVRASTALKVDTWTHIAATYEHAMGLRFAGEGRADAGDASQLDLTGDMTIAVGFVLNGGSGKTRGLVCMGTRQRKVGAGIPYALWIDADRKLWFGFEDGDGDWQAVASNKVISEGEFHRVAVARRRVQRRTETTDNLSLGGENIKVVTNVELSDEQEITFYVDKVQVRRYTFTGKPPCGVAGSLKLGAAEVDGTSYGFYGDISDVRLWSRALQGNEVGRRLTGNEQGLVGWWSMRRDTGSLAEDACGGAHARLRGATWIDSPDPDAAALSLFVNGARVGTTSATAPAWDASAVRVGKQATINGFHGEIDELRVWKVVRTQEQLRDNLYGRLKGETDQLVAAWSFDQCEFDAAGGLSRCLDGGLNGLHLTPDPAQMPSRVLSTAPISQDIPAIRPALGGVDTAYQDTGLTAPVAAEYADLQTSQYGQEFGVLKRAHAWIDLDGHWVLSTGFKVGNLETEWVGQAQYHAQVVGYVEGAPPFPSENLTEGAAVDDNVVLGTTSLVIEESEDVTYTASTSRERALMSSFELGGSLGTSIDTIIAPFGFGISIRGSVKSSLKGSMEATSTWGDEQSTSATANRTSQLTIGLGGSWEEMDARVNKHLTRRFAPTNMGYAVVQSETADVFALRLAHSGALVQYQLRPNQDIPRDYNLIPFQINPRYTKQGTLDGRLGMDENGQMVVDPDYGTATGYGEYSYYKPREAYALLRRIEREEQSLRALYDTLNVEPPGATAGVDALIGGGVAGLAAGAAAGIPGIAGVMLPVMGAATTVASLIGALKTDRRLPDRMASGNLANSYVWTADGGFLALTTQRSESRSESFSGDFEFAGSVQGGIQGEFEAPVALEFEINGMIGGSLRLSRTRSKEASRTFGITTVVNTPGDLQRYAYDANGEIQRIYNNGVPVNEPGKVDCYRFTTFYLEPDRQNAEDLFAKVVDPIWLANSTEPNARALREARQPGRMPACWRVFHRVTFVSRLLPPVPTSSTPAVPTLQDSMVGIGIASNWELLQSLRPHLDPHTTDRARLADQVRVAIKSWMPELRGHEVEIASMMADFLGLGE